MSTHQLYVGKEFIPEITIRSKDSTITRITTTAVDPSASFSMNTWKYIFYFFTFYVLNGQTNLVLIRFIPHHLDAESSLLSGTKISRQTNWESKMIKFILGLLARIL